MQALGCDVCKRNDFDVGRMERFVEYRSGREYPVLTCVCRCCGHAFMIPRMSPLEMEELYRGQLRESFQIARGEKIGLFEADTEVIRRVCGAGAGRRAIEVGCYTGFMLNHLANDGWTVEGLEPNADSAAEARRRFGFTVHEGMFEEVELVSQPGYDLMVMGSVLEHVNSPSEFVAKAWRLLKPGGALFVRVPDIEQICIRTIADAFPIEHPQTFSAWSLHLLCRAARFDEAFMGTHPNVGRHLITVQTKGAAPQTTSGNSSVPLTEGEASRGRANHAKVLAVLEGYAERVDRERVRVRRLLRHLSTPERRRVAVFGAGTHTEFLLRYSELSQAEIVCILDSNPKKWGTRFMGSPVVSPDRADEFAADVIVISSQAFHREMYEAVREYTAGGVEVIDLYREADGLGEA